MDNQPETKEATGIKDKTGKMIFVGDTVRKTWGWWARTGYDVKEHVIIKRVENNVIRYTLGNSYNEWASQEVELV
jgi:hypothetical protein